MTIYKNFIYILDWFKIKLIELQEQLIVYGYNLNNYFFLARYPKPDVSGIHAVSNQASWLLFPNPAKETITWSNLPTGIQNIHIYDLQGRNRITSALPSKAVETLDIGHLMPGVYFLAINGQEGRSVKKLIKHQ